MADPTKKALALPEARIQWLRLHHGAANELSDDSVPGDRREKFNQHREYHQQYTARWFENSCEWFGATDRSWATVPEKNQADALAYLGRGIAEHDNRCEYELDLFKIELAEQAADAATDDLDFG